MAAEFGLSEHSGSLLIASRFLPYGRGVFTTSCIAHKIRNRKKETAATKDIIEIFPTPKNIMMVSTVAVMPQRRIQNRDSFLIL